ncbi:MAG TPA: cytochrome c3 family protein [Nitrospiraceae bacterium]|jgi:hypothetical protein
MIRHLLAGAALILLVAAGLPAKSDTGQIPSLMTISSAVGEVTFLHEAHFKDRGIQCAECHHQINAKKLQTPHADYLQSSWINCKVCHEEQGKTKEQIYTCSKCHRTSPVNIADETLSAKVVIHKQCWKCHEVGTAKEAAKSCELCHSNKKQPRAPTDLSNRDASGER